ncbi:unnamed protein product [Dimorphilus gyrociliatus]|uniref:Uncharacterized protein n=1 Tax=Dimorphilus gyrociliatus TaxID=2664684 RepID=A0A7I8VXN2_9ANNE|nr:unnamed protein product [Dimorphilus gyrociliatus]
MANIPRQLQKYRDVIEKSKLEYVKVIICDEKVKVDIDDSKLGGYPCLPKNIEYPYDSKGNPLILQAQLNFNEIPTLNSYPKTGLLQFYLALDDVYGMNFDNPTDQKDFRLIYVKEYDKNNRQTDFSFVDNHLKSSSCTLPVIKQFRLTFEKDYDYVSMQDCRFEKFFGMEYDEFIDKFPSKHEEVVEEFFNRRGHKIGGYANFIQNDPRSNSSYKDYIQILQLDSEDDKICWGDVGVGNFFTTEEKLVKLDFSSSVLYNYDC